MYKCTLSKISTLQACVYLGKMLAYVLIVFLLLLLKAFILRVLSHIVVFPQPIFSSITSPLAGEVNLEYLVLSGVLTYHSTSLIRLSMFKREDIACERYIILWTNSASQKTKAKITPFHLRASIVKATI